MNTATVPQPHVVIKRLPKIYAHVNVYGILGAYVY